VDKLNTIKEAAERLSLAEITIRKWISNDKIKSVKLGGSRRIPESEIQRLIGGG
jgi:excisionase family DNA binding protein